MNQITHGLDGSNIYGRDEKKSRDLRLGSRGLLKFQTDPDGGQLLPEDSGTKVKCTKSGTARCFKAGKWVGVKPPSIQCHFEDHLRS